MREIVNPQSTSERVIDVASWVGVGAMGIVLMVGILAGGLYMLGFGNASPPMLFLCSLALGAFGVLTVAVFVAAITGGLARWRSRVWTDDNAA